MQMKATYEIPVKTISECNARGHWRVKNKRVQEQRSLAAMVTNTEVECKAKPTRITLTRINRTRHRLDVGNLAVSMKAVQDGVCDALGIDDGDPAIEWGYRQEQGEAYGVKVEVWYEPRR
jgi:hypothetical protein